MLSNPKPEFAIQGEGLGKDALADLHLTRQEVVNKVTIDCVLCWQQNVFAQVFSYWMCFRPRMCSLTRMCSRRWTRHRRGVLTTWSPGSMTQRAFCRCMPGSVLLFASRSVFPNFFFRLYHMLSVFDLHCLEFGRRVQFLVLYCSADVCPGWLESTVRKQVSRVRCSVFFCVDIYFQKNSGNMYPHRNSGNMFTHNYTHVCTQIYTPYQVRRVWCRSPEILEI